MTRFLEKVSELLELKYDFLRGLSTLKVLDIRRVVNVKDVS
jgi:hypothetical protein